MITLTVAGLPGPQGSKVMFAGGGSRESSAKVTPWREAVKAAYLALPDPQPVLGPVVLTGTFMFRRPTSHYRTGKNAHLLRASAPAFPTGRTSIGDLSKLVRSTEDALTDVGAWQDDCWVVALNVAKVWAPEGALAGARLAITSVDDHTAPQRWLLGVADVA